MYLFENKIVILSFIFLLFFLSLNFSHVQLWGSFHFYIFPFFPSFIYTSVLLSQLFGSLLFSLVARIVLLHSCQYWLSSFVSVVGLNRRGKIPSSVSMVFCGIDASNWKFWNYGNVVQNLYFCIILLICYVFRRGWRGKWRFFSDLRARVVVACLGKRLVLFWGCVISFVGAFSRFWMNWGWCSRNGFVFVTNLSVRIIVFRF